MEIRFKRPFSTNRLCMMQTSAPPELMFKGSFVLDKGNIEAFIGYHDFCYGKFVFGKNISRLAMAPGDDELHHRQIARSLVPGELGNTKVFGAFVEFERGKNEVSFVLGGFSGTYGTPSPSEFSMVADHISELLNHIDYETEIKVVRSFTYITGRKV